MCAGCGGTGLRRLASAADVLVVTGVTPKLTNNGLIQADEDGTLTIGSSDVLSLDLDGDSFAGQIKAVDGNVTVQASLTDAFDGQITIGEARTVRFNNGFTLGSFGRVVLDGTLADPARLKNTIAVISGTIVAQGHGILDATTQTTFKPGSDIDFAAGTTLEIKGTTIFEGGNVNLANGSVLKLDGPTTIESGSFDVPDGTLLMNETATLDGTFSPSVGGQTMVVSGTIDVSGHARISADVSFKQTSALSRSMQCSSGRPPEVLTRAAPGLNDIGWSSAGAGRARTPSG